MKERLRQFRKALGYTQADFATKLGIKGASLSDLEKGKSNITERLIISLCNIYSLNRGWLETGEGEMLLTSSGGLLDELAAEYRLDRIEKLALKTYIELPERDREFFKKYIGMVLKNSENPPAD
ncbi:hypothetical protein FACS1894217_11880 [Clostridia bacterium]|nr:hypothetical protein FACS1894217_11880 [Clostridia bacterium]